MIPEVHASEKPKHNLSFTTDNAKDISGALKGTYHWLGCVAHHLNLVVQEAFKKNKVAAHILQKCKKIVSAINYSNTILYDVRKYQQELGLPPVKLLQEVSTRWWSILAMLISIKNERSATTLALNEAGKNHLILTNKEFSRILEIIVLLQVFKDKTDQLGVKDDITITKIVPTFEFFRKYLRKPQENESKMLKSMKVHMLTKLETRYSKEQFEYLSQCSYLDPRFKKSVHCDLPSFTERVKDIALSYTEIIHDTQSQSLQNIQNSHTRREQPTPSTSKDTENDIFSDDDSEDESELTSTNDLSKRISLEIDRFSHINLKREQKHNIRLISWWQERKEEYPYLFKAVRAMLCTPATSVPCERIFSEAGYISRAKRSRILPENLDKILFIKKNQAHLPKTISEFYNNKNSENSSIIQTLF